VWLTKSGILLVRVADRDFKYDKDAVSEVFDAIIISNDVKKILSDGNVMTLLSSGNIVARLDVNNDAAGHRFIVQDYTGASQFFVSEDGNTELTGSFTATGSIKALSGFSGSLTKLADGTDYLIAGSNITLGLCLMSFSH